MKKNPTMENNTNITRASIARCFHMNTRNERPAYRERHSRSTRSTLKSERINTQGKNPYLRLMPLIEWVEDHRTVNAIKMGMQRAYTANSIHSRSIGLDMVLVWGVSNLLEKIGIAYSFRKKIASKAENYFNISESNMDIYAISCYLLILFCYPCVIWKESHYLISLILNHVSMMR